MKPVKQAKGTLRVKQEEISLVVLTQPRVDKGKHTIDEVLVNNQRIFKLELCQSDITNHRIFGVAVYRVNVIKHKTSGVPVYRLHLKDIWSSSLSRDC